MKKVSILVLLFCYKASAQNGLADHMMYDCAYATTFNQLFEQGQRPKKFESELITAHDKSVFFTLPTKETYADDESDEDSRNLFFKEDTLFKIIKFTDVNLLLFNDKAFSKKEKQYTDTLYPMQWELGSEKKLIDSLQCYKATTFFKGRNYIAWYCPAISIPNGPWKLGGLPGLIIEAYDENKDLHFFLKSFKIIGYSAILEKIEKPRDFELISSYPDYVKNGIAFLKRMREQLGSESEGNCLDCHNSTKIELHNWENVIH